MKTIEVKLNKHKHEFQIWIDGGLNQGGFDSNIFIGCF